MHYYVAKTGCDTNPGTSEAPFLTINRAAALAFAGDTITVREGVYREWVNPANPGTAVMPIIYEAAPGEKVVITGSEVVTGWTQGDGLWTVSVPNSVFGPRHPYLEEVFGDWKFDFGPVQKIVHTGGVYLDGEALTEAQTEEELGVTPMTWRAAVDANNTIFTANFGDRDPNAGLTEYTARPNVFWPEKTNMDYITVRGFELRHAATNWAPPTGLQEGLIGPHWSKGWVIEDNIIHDTMCVGLSLGKDVTSGHNEWSRLHTKEGTQRERESIFRALHRDWDRHFIGSHTVRNNVIYNCEQAGIVGHLGGVFSVIEHNHIHHVAVRGVIRGAEQAGIKLHAAIDVLIKDNFIHDCNQGVWLDWQDQGSHITGNTLFRNFERDIFVEIAHGPCLIDNNVMLSELSINNACQGTAVVHNLMAGRINLITDTRRHTPYHFPHETAVFGLATVPGGDDRFYNNIFVRQEDSHGPEDDEPKHVERSLDAVEGAPKMAMTIYPTGLSCYNGYPGPEDKPWEEAAKSFGPRREPFKLPVFIDDNFYFHRAVPWENEPVKHQTEAMGLTFSIEGDKVTLNYKDTAILGEGCNRLLDTEALGVSFQTESKYTDPDNKPYTFDKDMLGNPRRDRPTAGPLELASLKDSKITLEY